MRQDMLRRKVGSVLQLSALSHRHPVFSVLAHILSYTLNILTLKILNAFFIPSSLLFSAT